MSLRLVGVDDDGLGVRDNVVGRRAASSLFVSVTQQNGLVHPQQETSTDQYAHSLLNRPKSEWEPLSAHLAKVADTASEYADSFGAASWENILGQCHDLGKLSAEFQNYIGGPGTESADASSVDGLPGRVDHSTFGARFVAQKIADVRGQILAFCIAGHHAGLPDESSAEETTQRGTLRWRLDATKHLTIPHVQSPLVDLESPRLKLRPADKSEQAFQIAFFTRMLFSCLVDADRTRTEEFCDPEAASERGRERPSLMQLKHALDAMLEKKGREAKASDVNRHRASVLQQCRGAAPLIPGFFSLNVPTGGGKTYASLAFALDHAASHADHRFRRVVVAIPFTSIIEQNADVYREALGSLAKAGMVEHHTNLRPEHATRANQLGTETWDAPLIVTTNVQLLESLFASATTPCRKIHRLARSIIVLDEAQTMPVHLLRPALAALRELVLNYGCSIVFCTATQPALEYRKDFDLGIRDVRPIIPEAPALFQALKRVQVHALPKVADDDLAQRLTEQSAVLCIVNTRGHAARLYDLVAGSSEAGTCFHLSTWMCGQHRRDVLKIVCARLEKKLPCRLISTQLVEAGVDLDFPTVYRAAAGFDSIAQAAGRCNREGNLLLGHTYLFESEKLSPAGLLRDAAQTGQELLPHYPDPLAPDAIAAYFRQFYWTQKERWDKNEVMSRMTVDHDRKRLLFNFREISSRFRMIEDEQVPILVPYDETALGFRDTLLLNPMQLVSHRALQPYLVSVRKEMLRDLERNAMIQQHDSGVWLLLNRMAYTEEKGLSPELYGLDPSFWGI